MIDLKKLRELALKSPSVVFDIETESGRFYNAASPDVILSLLDKIDAAREALEYYSSEKAWYLHKDPITKSEIRRSIEYDDTESFGKLLDNGDNILNVLGGKRARQALERMGKT